MPVYLVNAGETVFDKFQAANEAYATEETSATMASFNQTFPVRRVVVAKDSTSDLTTYVNDAYYSLFTRAMRTPVVKAGLFVAANEFSGYSWNQAPYTLTDRNAVLDGVTADGIHVVEHQEDPLQPHSGGKRRVSAHLVRVPAGRGARWHGRAAQHSANPVQSWWRRRPPCRPWTSWA